MTQYNFFFFACIGAAIIQVTSAGFDGKEIECKGVKYEIDAEHLAKMQECLNKIGVASMKDLSANNAGCFSRCCMMQKGLIDDSGKAHKEKIMNMMESKMPDALKNEWKGPIEACLDNEGSKIDVKDETTCSTFLPLAMCMHQAFIKICK